MRPDHLQHARAGRHARDRQARERAVPRFLRRLPRPARAGAEGEVLARAGPGARHAGHRRLHAAHQRDQLRARQRRRRGARDYERADVILVGVSRSGKTPTCLYMALQYGVFAANFPLTEEELETGALPASLAKRQRKLYGLTIAPERLQQIRNERRPNSNYSSPSQVEFEVRAAEAIFRRYDIPCSTQPNARSKRSPVAFSTRPGSNAACDRDASLMPSTAHVMPSTAHENRCAIFGLMLATLEHDTNCAVSWRARPGSFVSLMSLYESNYIRLAWLVPDLHGVRGLAGLARRRRLPAASRGR